jgi:hypothetical protein
MKQGRRHIFDTPGRESGRGKHSLDFTDLFVAEPEFGCPDESLNLARPTSPYDRAGYFRSAKRPGDGDFTG